MVMKSTPLQLTNFLVVALFHHALFVTGVGLFVAIGMLLLLAGVVTGRIRTFNLSPAGLAEPRARSVLRLVFGLIWFVDGLLQFQPSMPLGLANAVVAPAMSGTPSWLHSLMTSSINLWNEHPINLAVGTAWIQVGIGLALILSNNVIGRVVACISVGWAAMIWLIGNGAGGIFASTGSVLFGWPGATLFYVIAGVWLVVPNEVFVRHFSKWTLRFLAFVALLGAIRQCLPSVGFWHGGNSNALTAMTQAMTSVAQPHWVASIALRGGQLAGTLGGGFNIMVVLWLVATAVGLWFATDRNWRWPVWSMVVFAVVFWFVAEDAAFWGGVATDFNSLIPLAALSVAALPTLGARPPLPRRLPPELRSLSGAVLASVALGMVLYSIGLMSVSLTQPAESTLFVAANGYASGVTSKAPTFTLTDQNGQQFALADAKGQYVLLTFLDPVCWTDCPLLAAQLKAARASFPQGAKLTEVAVAANPLHETPTNVRHFIAQHNLGGVPNFHFVTGSLSALRAVWHSWGIQVSNVPSSKMSIHSDYFFVINPQGQLKWIVPDDPLSGGVGVQNSDVSELVSLLHQSGLSS